MTSAWLIRSAREHQGLVPVSVHSPSSDDDGSQPLTALGREDAPDAAHGMTVMLCLGQDRERVQVRLDHAGHGQVSRAERGQ